MNLKGLEVRLKPLRNSIKSSGAYPVRTQTLDILEYLKKYAEPIRSENEIVYIGKTKYPKYVNIQTAQDIIDDRLDVVCMAYDSAVDRFITWFKEIHRVDSYEKSLRNASHVGTIGIIDLKQNIDSLESLVSDNEFLDFKDELIEEINYWKSYYYEADGKTIKFKYYVIIGKNRTLLAIPKIYEKYVEQGNIESVSKLLEIDLKIWTKFVSREFKTELYRNEKNNMKDTELQELIGWGGPFVDFIHLYPKKKLPAKVIRNIFSDDALLMIKDRDLIVDFYLILHNKLHDNEFKRNMFIKGTKVRNDFEKYLNFWFNLIQAWLVYRENGEHKRYPITSGDSWRYLLFALVVNIIDNPLEINLTDTDKYKKIISIALEVRAELEDEKSILAYLSNGTELRIKNLFGGISGSTCYFHSDYSRFDKNFVFDEDVACKSKNIKFGLQYEVLTNVFFDRFWMKITEEGLAILPAKRGFEPSEVSYVVKRDAGKVRINGEVYNSKNEVIRFSDEHPDDEFIVKYGTDVEYVVLPYSQLMGDSVQIDHIPAYVKNKETRDLDMCEATTANFNNWKKAREAVYQDIVLEDIQYRKSLAPKSIEDFA
jgi:hypothetical protein